MRSIQHAVRLLSIILAFGAGLLSLEAKEGKELPAAEVSWREIARKKGLKDEDVQKLGQNKILVTNKAFKQVFDPYIHADQDLPLFITSDSLLNGFHVLFEESILRLENSNARRLPDILRFIWANLVTVDKDLKGRPELAASAKKRAQIIIATALSLLGIQNLQSSEQIKNAVKTELKRIVDAKARLKPKWLGEPDDGFDALDYSRYRPKGFYARSKSLQQYFRAVSWLQSIPFRVKSDEELLSALMLGNTITYQRFRGMNEKERTFESFFRCFRTFIGAGDDWDLLAVAHHAQGKLNINLGNEGLARVRKNILKSATDYGDGPQINDQLRFLPEGPKGAAEVQYRILAAYRTPDSILFQRTTDPGKLTRTFPDGLEVCAALGSSWAIARLKAKNKDELLRILKKCTQHFKGSSLYHHYLRCLAALLDPPEPDAPKFMANNTWKTKSCGTVLAGWAQLRHTWSLQAKQTVYYMGLTRKPAGFIEPEPEFFSRMTSLVERTSRVLRTSGAFELDLESMATEIRKVVKLIADKDFPTKGREAFQSLNHDEAMLMEQMGQLLWSMGVKADRKNMGAFFAEVSGKLKELAGELERGELPRQAKVRSVLKKTLIDIEPLWRQFGVVSRRLEALSHKQLRGVAFSIAEEQFIRGYGESIARIMLYGGNSYLTPRDDSPRIVDVFHNPGAGQFLEVGIARARALYVLYPFQGKEVLCRGAIMPYYEFRHTKRLTDKEWKAQLDSKKRPPVPEWIKPILAIDGITVPKLGKKR